MQKDRDTTRSKGGHHLSWPAVVLWVLILAASMLRGPALLYLLYVTGVFGTVQMIPGDASVNLLPQSVCAAFLINKVFQQQGNLVKLIEIAVDPGRMGLFTAFLAYALLTAIVLPRLFAGQIEVTPISYVSGTSLLYPSSGNITQSGYLVLSFVTALCFALIARREDFQRHFLISLLAGAAFVIASGLIDLTFYDLGLSGLLDPLRTASYTLLTNDVEAGAKRVVGFTSEASSYGSMCLELLTALAFLRPLFPPALRVFVVVVLLALAGMAALSTSSGAYVGLAVFLVVYAFDLATRLSSHNVVRRGGVLWEIGLLGAFLFVFLTALLVSSELFNTASQMIDEVIFNKSHSASYVERSEWTRVGWQAFLDTGGLGVGFGSLRTSNWFVSVLGNTGIFGGLLMFGFIVRLFTLKIGESDMHTAIMIRALRLALIPTLAESWLAGSIPDIGIVTTSFLGILASIPMAPSAKAEPAEHTDRMGRGALAQDD
jgi:hypothetical protein